MVDISNSRQQQALTTRDRNDHVQLIRAAEDGRIKRVKNLIYRGDDVNEKNEFGTTPLMAAAINGQIDYVLILIAHGANIDLRDHNGKTAKDYAQAAVNQALEDDQEDYRAVECLGVLRELSRVYPQKVFGPTP